MRSLAAPPNIMHMGFFDDVFDPRRGDWGQLQALKELDQEFDELSTAVERGDAALGERITKLREHVGFVRQRLNRVELVTEALFAHLESQGAIDRTRLRSLMEEIDARDGEKDGRAKQRGT